MKRTIAVILIFTIMLTAVNAVTQSELDSSLRTFAEQVADFVPRSSAGTNFWADAHIGNLFPLNGLPHLGAGLSVSGSLIPTAFMKTFSQAFSDPVNTWESFPLPAMSFDARVGGIILPFDIGAHVMVLDDFEDELLGVSVTIDTCLEAGADLRFAILQEGVVLPALSIGVGYTYSKGDFSFTSKSITDVSNILSSSQASVTTYIEYETTIYTATAQLSKKILLLTPFVGARAIAQDGTYRYGGGYQNIEGNRNNLSLSTITKTFSFDDLQDSLSKLKYNVFAGVGLDFLIIQTTVGASYDFTDESWSGSVSLHVKI
ncbi:MAG: hypothetical protein K5930_07885 [Treponemataceae bacterium]|nr:hypothetical protein [Treponemataceae bacterium]